MAASCADISTLTGDAGRRPSVAQGSRLRRRWIMAATLAAAAVSQVWSPCARLALTFLGTSQPGQLQQPGMRATSLTADGLARSLVARSAEGEKNPDEGLPKAAVIEKTNVEDVVADEDAEPLTGVQAGDRFTGWLQHPVLTKSAKYYLTIEVGPTDTDGIWRIDRPPTRKGAKASLAFEGKCEVDVSTDGSGKLAMLDENTRLNGTMNSAGPGTFGGRVSQCGLSWGGFFEVKLERS
eukprot:TRINITY_DN82139_c0_g1_i1.p1 TRINITY_DN82139_c0_g1~~TRINITY_DN82139_c0_g1_i1.p1  ORF type:complete len:238 (-),score=41.24 TRINITY_DN82139_c0_g1_i1:125-838(-)